jgi:hypothetical protein
VSNPLKTYVEGIHRELDFFPAWPPNAPHALGDVGLLKNGQFQQLTSLSNLGIDFHKKAGSQAADLSITSGKSVSVQIKAKGETLQGSSLPKAKAAALVEFKAAGAFVFQARGFACLSRSWRCFNPERRMAVADGTRTGAPSPRSYLCRI